MEMEFDLIISRQTNMAVMSIADFARLLEALPDEIAESLHFRVRSDDPVLTGESVH